MLILNPMKKLQESCLKKWRENGVFDFHCCVQKFLAYNFFMCMFLQLVQQIQIQHQIL